MAKYMVLSFAIAGMIVGGWALVYGYSAGIRKRRILADHSGTMTRGGARSFVASSIASLEP
jgi:hypothetical protein